MKIIFTADFFREQVHGGAECADQVLINWLNDQGHDVEVIACSAISLDFLNANVEASWIIGNFVTMSNWCKDWLTANAAYVIYEHDHKYLKTRDPSQFNDYLAPKSQIINEEFYANALSIICLSKVHKECVEKNLGIDHVVNIGTSLWSEQDLDFLEQLAKNPIAQQGSCSIKWNNPIKGYLQAKRYVKNKKCMFIEQSSWKKLMREMNKYERFIFFPQVLETFSRIAIEAKMLGLKLTAPPTRLGAASEPGVMNKNGLELVQEMRKRVREALPMFIKPFEQASVRKTQEMAWEDITVVLTCYRRPHVLKEQIDAVRSQSIQPKEIWVLVNEHEDNQDFGFSSLDIDRLFHLPGNYGPGGRFILGGLVESEFVAFFDDDTIPGLRWFENCLKCMEKKEGIYGGVGIRMHQTNSYQPNTRYGWPSANRKIEEVDLVGHAWFFKREHLGYFNVQQPITLMNGEDIHFSAMAQIHGGVRTFVPPHPMTDKSLWSSIKPYAYGVDNVAMSSPSNHFSFYKTRDDFVQHAVAQGWELCCVRKQ